ncbi:DUF6542 domain-containing protein [Streptomyces caatingaensis]|uniref:DUF6542 domain-containing protein n=1 Tax=Streptomyces caatingaensis TaxID=1678637 RepID=UPI0012FF3B3E|nr:DUF6542 domain-containing protein [Streptomyces caatingaensis]
MEQPGARISQHKVRRAAPVPRPAAPLGQDGGPPAGRARPGRSPRPVARALRRTQDLRLTGLGNGLLTTLAMLGAGELDAVAAHGSPALYGAFYVLCCAVCALSVRPAELVAAPVAVPIAFAVGALPVVGGAGGLTGRAMGLVSFLSLQAPWLYAGTLLAGLITLVRRVSLVRHRRLVRSQQRKRPSRPPRSPRCSPAEQARSRR